MNSARFLAFVAPLALTSCFSSETPPVVHWGYDADDGPARWSAMNSDWTLCGEGSAQSPIDLTDAVGGSLEPFEIRTPSLAQVTVRRRRSISPPAWPTV